LRPFIERSLDDQAVRGNANLHQSVFNRCLTNGIESGDRSSPAGISKRFNEIGDCSEMSSSLNLKLPDLVKSEDNGAADNRQIRANWPSGLQDNWLAMPAT
jgi:hypothetical protein